MTHQCTAAVNHADINRLARQPCESAGGNWEARKRYWQRKALRAVPKDQRASWWYRAMLQVTG
jgi:hypothetical protein